MSSPPPPLRPPLLLLVLLLLSVSQARVVSRCELRDELLGRVQLPETCGGARRALARERRSVREKRASISVASVKYFGIFQYSDQKYCDSGYSYGEDRCSSDCFAFADDDISDDVSCFVQSRLFWEVYRGASKSCKAKQTLDSFFEACDAGAEPGSGDHLAVWFSISSYN